KGYATSYATINLVLKYRSDPSDERGFWNTYPYFNKRDNNCELSTINSQRSEEHTSELQSRENLVCRLLLEKKKDCYLHSFMCRIPSASRLGTNHWFYVHRVWVSSRSTDSVQCRFDLAGHS